ncbi:protein GRAVITROPIC IN THE LIGHT 1-like [Rhodamnia argentea]|uniref:Protein GRAVITROPIC IN THE LIGHT 1-like n=1 Tax=Rhodamnia argentea TaxID=178133 RepID=A0A8B8QRV0_9MYRT|nr:protein GRAVITROPIC IN THE LIGHT 1-like [Rhodamnia argentea]XP_030549745.1 protein GRAVITROPIC IN THE LIGHT 1-like [Rhodamnia argentea]XP_048130035.1 protein GRAVITROPIC IN THE LIGHT 1-like [Rhodamnia argentea]XP_048130036.1 protein GRAVITROPIC IN THE LIGHT 1-like [Rhodamnia argentea]
MDSVKRSSSAPSKSRLARTLSKVLHIRVATGIAPDDEIKKPKPQKVVKDNQLKDDPSNGSMFEDEEDETQDREALEALLAKIFASISSVKAAYAKLQFAQSPYDAEGIQSADQMIVSELKNLSELKQCYVKRQFDISPETTMLLAEIQEQKFLLKTYEIMCKKMEFQQKVKDSELASLKQKLEELNNRNRMTEKRLNQSGPLSVLDNLHLSGLSPNHFVTVLRHTVKSIRSFVRLLIDEMKSADWDVEAAASAIEPGVVYWRPDHKCFAFESFVCREMFDGFQFPYFSITESLPERRRWQQVFFERFVELKSSKAKDYLSQKPRSTFAKFCRVKYLRIIHPRMESAFFGNTSHRNLVSAGEFPETTFFAMFAEMAKRVWLLHCLAFSFQPEGTIFQVSKGSRFSEVYMETIAEEEALNTAEYDPRVAFTVVPGFKIGKTVIQCQVYLLNSNESR